MGKFRPSNSIQPPNIWTRSHPRFSRLDKWVRKEDIFNRGYIAGDLCRDAKRKYAEHGLSDGEAGFETVGGQRADEEVGSGLNKLDCGYAEVGRVGDEGD